MRPPVQTELDLPNPDYREEVVWVDEVTTATERLRLDGFQVTAWAWLIGKGQYRLHASRITRPCPDLDVQPKAL